MKLQTKFTSPLLLIFLLFIVGCTNNIPSPKDGFSQLLTSEYNAPSFIFSDTIILVPDKSKAIFSGKTWGGIPAAYINFTEKEKRDTMNYIPYAGLIVGLLSLDNNTVYRDTIFEKNGKFSFVVPEGKYLFEVLNSKPHNEKMTNTFYLKAGEKRERIYVYQ